MGMRQAQDYSYASLLLQGPEVTAYTFAKYMGMKHWRVKHLINMNLIPHRVVPDKWTKHGHRVMVPNPALDPKMMDAEWDQFTHTWVTLFPGVRSDG